MGSKEWGGNVKVDGATGVRLAKRSETAKPKNRSEMVSWRWKRYTLGIRDRTGGCEERMRRCLVSLFRENANGCRGSLRAARVRIGMSCVASQRVQFTGATFVACDGRSRPLGSPHRPAHARAPTGARAWTQRSKQH